MAERVAGEDLGSQDDEVTDEPAPEADEAARDQRVAHEFVGEHQKARTIRTKT